MSKMQLKNAMFKFFELYKDKGTVSEVTHYYISKCSERNMMYYLSKIGMEHLFLRLKEDYYINKTSAVVIKVKLNNYTTISLSFEFYRNTLSSTIFEYNNTTGQMRCLCNRDVLNLDIDSDIKKIIIDNLNLMTLE